MTRCPSCRSLWRHRPTCEDPDREARELRAALIEENRRSYVRPPRRATLTVDTSETTA